MSEPTILASQIPSAQESKRTVRSRLVASIASAILPGLGQVFLGKVVSGSILLALYVLIWLGYVLLRAPESYWAFLGLLFGTVVLVLFAVFHSAYSRDQRYGRFSKWWIVPLAGIAWVAMYLHMNVPDRLAGFRPFSIPSTSMEPTILPGDHLMVDLRCYKDREPRHGDIVIFRKDDLYIMKRVVAVAGETIEGYNREIFLNGQLLNEPYVVHRLEIPGPHTAEFGPIKVPEGKLFVMGDNRDVSYDSRQPEYGFVDVRDVQARPLYVFYSKYSARNGLRIQ